MPMGGHALEIDRDLEFHLAGPLEDQRDRHGLSLNEGLRETEEHDVIAATLQGVGPARRDHEALLDLAHAHHAVTCLFVGVQFHPVGGIGPRGDKPIIRRARVLDGHECRTGLGGRHGGACIRVCHADFRQRGHGDEKRRGASDQSCKFHVFGPFR